MFCKVSKAQFTKYLESFANGYFDTVQKNTFVDDNGVLVTQYIVGDDCVAYSDAISPRYEYYVRSFEV